MVDGTFFFTVLVNVGAWEKGFFAYQSGVTKSARVTLPAKTICFAGKKEGGQFSPEVLSTIQSARLFFACFGRHPINHLCFETYWLPTPALVQHR